MVVGIAIALFQALTQIQEATLTFVPKIIAVLVAIALSGSLIGAQIHSLHRTGLWPRGKRLLSLGACNARARPEERADQPKSCFNDFYTYMTSTIKDCPLSYAGVTLFGNIDGGYGYKYAYHADGLSADKVNYAIQRNSGRGAWQWSPNTSRHRRSGVTVEEKIVDKWLFIGVAETGFNPYSLNLINGPQSLAYNNFDN